MPELNEIINSSDKYTITKDDFLLRRFPVINEPKFIPFFKVIDGKPVPTSAAFKTKSGENGLSVNIEALTENMSLFVKDKDLYKIAKFAGSIPIDNGYVCEHDPNPPEDPGNFAHALIIGDTEKLAKKISKNCSVL